MENTHMLLLCSFNYADEFNCESMVLMTTAEWEQYQVDLKEAFAKVVAHKAAQIRPPGLADWKWRNQQEVEIEVGFGTNEALTFNNAGDVLCYINPVPVTDAEVEFLKRIFHGQQTFGTASDVLSRVLSQAIDLVQNPVTCTHG